MVGWWHLKPTKVCGGTVESDTNQDTWSKGMVGPSCLSYWPVALRKPHDRGNLSGRHFIGGLLAVPEGKSMIMVGNVEAGRLAWCWKSS